MDVIVFAIVAFVLSGIIILNRERIPEHLRRPLAIFALVLVVAAFAMVVASFFLLPG